MKPMSDADWNRIYAFIWKKSKAKDDSYKTLFETDPKKAVEKIQRELKGTGRDLDYDRLFDIGKQPEDLTDEQLDAIIKGEAVAFLQVRLCC